MANALAAPPSAPRPLTRARQVVALSGDGAGLADAARRAADACARCSSRSRSSLFQTTGALSFVELEMKAAGIVTFGTDLVDPELQRDRQVRRAVRRPGPRRPAKLERGAADGGSPHDGPATGRTWRTAPPGALAAAPSSTFGQIKGLHPVCDPGPILSGEGSELVGAHPAPTCGSWKPSEPPAAGRGAWSGLGGPRRHGFSGRPNRANSPRVNGR